MITQIEINGNKLNTGKSVLVESYTDPNTHQWYRVYSDGWCEQGGISEGSSRGPVTITVNFLKSYINTNYVVIGSKNQADETAVGINCPVNKNKSYFTWSIGYNPQSLNRTLHWIAKGYINL